jgi:hypothetical protein
MTNNSNLRNDVRTSIAAAATDELADELLDEFDELNKRFYLGDYRPTELSGGRFGEAAFRICQHVCIGNYTPLNKKLPRIDQLVSQLENTPSASADDTFRIHIPRTLRLIYDLRNKRDVAHLGTNISPNFPDSSLVLTCAAWVVAEVVRIFHKCDSVTAQTIVDNLVVRRTPLIWVEGELVRVLDVSLPYDDQVLIILHHLQPDWIENRKLFKWVGYSNFSAFQKNVLSQLHIQALIHVEGEKSKILPPGNARVEEILAEQRKAKK